VTDQSEPLVVDGSSHCDVRWGELYIGKKNICIFGREKYGWMKHKLSNKDCFNLG